jgi:hypothetical protein
MRGLCRSYAFPPPRARGVCFHVRGTGLKRKGLTAMAEDEATRIAKVESRQDALLDIYSEVFRALDSVDRDKYDVERLQQLDEALDPPNEIEPAKAIAVLKAILGSTSEDKLQLEGFHMAPIDGGSLVGSYVESETKKLGIGYGDFYPFLRVKGWLRA